MAEPFLGEVRAFGFNYAPRDWALCDGALLDVNQNQALFSLMGNSFGGDGQNNFALPDLQGRSPMHFGGNYSLGALGGENHVTLTDQTIPAHSHSVKVADENGTTTSPGGAYLGKGAVPAGRVTDPWPTYVDATPDQEMAGETLQAAGRGLPHENRQPYLVINYCIALQGLYPPRS